MKGYPCKRGKSEKSDGKKDMQYTFIRNMGGYNLYTTKKGEKG
jgi:hypothetical protein